MSREAMQMALEALEQYKGVVVTHHDPESFRLKDVDGGQAARAAIAALKQALAEPDYWQEEARRYAGNADYWRKRYKALAEPEQEPVAWVLVTPYGEEDDIFYTEPETVPDGWSYKPLYDTAPTPRKPLTMEQLHGIREHKRLLEELGPVWAPMLYYFCQSIERAHGIGEQHE